jgi:hypothetical protein
MGGGGGGGGSYSCMRISCSKNYHGIDMVSDYEKEEAKQMSQVLLTLESAAVL